MEKDLQHIEEVLAGKTAVFAKLVDKHQSYVFSVVLRVLKSREEAEEAAQDTFVKAFKMLNTFNGKSKFTTWLYRIAYNTAIDYSRKKKRHTQSIHDDERFVQIVDQKTTTTFEQLEAKQRHYYLNKLISRLPTDDGLLITLFYLKEHSIEEVATLTSLSASNVKVKLYRLRKKLKKGLEVLLNDEAKELL